MWLEVLGSGVGGMAIMAIINGLINKYRNPEQKGQDVADLMQNALSMVKDADTYALESKKHTIERLEALVEKGEERCEKGEKRYDKLERRCYSLLYENEELRKVVSSASTCTYLKESTNANCPVMDANHKRVENMCVYLAAVQKRESDGSEQE